MGIYIKDIEMPNNCTNCKMCYNGGYCLLVEDATETSMKRPDWCPLTKVPDNNTVYPLCKKRDQDRCNEYCDGYRFYEECYEPIDNINGPVGYMVDWDAPHEI